MPYLISQASYHSYANFQLTPLPLYDSIFFHNPYVQCHRIESKQSESRKLVIFAIGGV